MLVLSFLKNDCFLKTIFRDLSHILGWFKWRLSITFVQNHKVIEHFYYNNVHLNDIFHFVSARNWSLRKQMSCAKIKGAIIIHMKFSGARKIKIVRCFGTLHVQIFSGFKNWDIQDLTLKRCDTLKSCRWNFSIFCWVVHYRKICKNQV